MSIFSNLKTGAIKLLLKSKLKNLPEKERDMFIAMIDKNPQLFQNIAQEIDAKKKAGMGEMEATIKTMKAHQAELQQLMQATGNVEVKQHQNNIGR